MGSWSVYCGISNISITDGQECVLLPLKKNKNSFSYMPYIPATMPIFGKYNDYGGIESIEENENTKLISEHFNMTIEQFCENILEEDNTIENKECEKWKFMFIDRKIYDFLSNHNGDKYGDHDYGNPEFLKYIGAEYIGIDKSINRYNQAWNINGVKFDGDGTWLQSNGKPIYNYDPSILLNVLPDDKKDIIKLQKNRLWKIFTKEYQADNMFWIIGIDGSHYRHVKFLSEIEDKLDDETYAKIFPDKIRHQKEELLEIKDKYIDMFDTFGDYFADLIIIRKNLHAFSQCFNPYIHYLTPQCGEFAQHQQILEKFAEINKSYINSEDDY